MADLIKVPFLIGRVALVVVVVVGRERRIRTVVGIGLTGLSGLMGHSPLKSCHCRWRLVGSLIWVESWSISARFGCRGLAAVGSGVVSGSDKHKRYAYHLRGSLLAMAVAVTRREPATIQSIKY